MSEKKFYYKVSYGKLVALESVNETAQLFYVKNSFWDKLDRKRKSEYFETALAAWEAEEARQRRNLQAAKDEVSRRQQKLQIAQKEVAACRKTNK